MTPIAFRNNFDRRPYTPLRIQRSNDAVRKAFTGFADHVLFLDPTMSGRNREDVNQVLPCNSLHTSFFHMQVELDAVFGALCPVLT